MRKFTLRDLTSIFNVLFDKDFKNEARYDKIIKWSSREYGCEDDLTKQLTEDHQLWIKELIAKRNAIEHPGGYSGDLYIKNCSYGEHEGNKGVILPLWLRNSEHPTSIVHDMCNYVHNIFTFAEEIFVLCLQKVDLHGNLPMKIVEIPQTDRSVSTPVMNME